jgi:hypothetical protein
MRHLLDNSPAVRTLLRVEHRIDGGIEQFKTVAILVDGSRLHVNEVRVNGVLHKYAYYWLTPTDVLIAGWDNAPHHPHVASHPAHQHDATGISASSIQSLADALAEIERRL